MNQFFKLIFFSTLLTLSLVACNNGGSEQSRSRQIIPKDVTYSIIETNVVKGIKRSLDVRLSRKVTEDVLYSIALELKSQDPKEYERTFICYYLPDMKVGAGVWATTHFDPDLDVRILGLTAEQEESFVNEPEDSSREVVGNWLNESLLPQSKITIYSQNGKLYMEKNFKDGSSSNKEMMKKASSSGQWYEEKSGSSFGEYYLIDRQGNLQIHDSDGLIATAKKIK
jgi:hypothetical protein